MKSRTHAWPGTRRAAAMLGAVIGLLALAPSSLASDTSRWTGIAGSWLILDEGDRDIGHVTFRLGGAVGAEGMIGAREFFADTKMLGDDGLTLNVFFGIGDRSGPHVLMLSEDRDEPADRMNGTLASPGRWTVVSLVRDAIDTGGADEGDLPGVGVSGPPYRLRNVPAEGWVRVHRTARVRSSQFDMRLSRESEDILVLECDPFVEAYIFEEADFAGKLGLLDGLWCRVDHTDDRGIVTSGWVRGSNLEPMRERMGDIQ